MGDSNPPSTELLKTVLEPLLEDFQYWFGRSLQLLENEKIQFMSDKEQFDLLQRVKEAQAELSTAKMLFTATDRQVGIEMATLMPWHQLVAECGNVGMRYRQSKQD
jgi:Protein of unknown function (DUF2605)